MSESSAVPTTQNSAVERVIYAMALIFVVVGAVNSMPSIPDGTR